MRSDRRADVVVRPEPDGEPLLIGRASDAPPAEEPQPFGDGGRLSLTVHQHVGEDWSEDR